MIRLVKHVHICVRHRHLHGLCCSLSIKCFGNHPYLSDTTHFQLKLIFVSVGIKGVFMQATKGRVYVTSDKYTNIKSLVLIIVCIYASLCVNKYT